MSETRVEWGFRLPPREMSTVILALDEDEARAFVQHHPKCTLVRRVVQTEDWTPMDLHPEQ